MGGNKKYRFTRKDFGPLTFYPLHYDLLFDVRADCVRVTAKQTYMYMHDEPSSRLTLDSHNLDVHSVDLFASHSPLGPPVTGIDAQPPDFVAHVASLAQPRALPFHVEPARRALLIDLPAPVHRGQEIAIQTVSTCRPNDRELEGIYLDYTPPGAPPTMITQCQQYGFQRIVPCVDRMISKLFYTTTLVADQRYTNLLTNGDLAPGFFHPADRSPRYHSVEEVFGEQAALLLPEYAGPPRHVLRYYNHTLNMAPYLFFFGVGTYEVYRRAVEYPRGETFQLELVCFPHVVKPEHAAASLQALHDSILWTFVSCGPEAHAHPQEEAQIYALLAQREQLKLALYGSPVHLVGQPAPAPPVLTESQAQTLSEQLEGVRGELRALVGVWGETGYQYTGTCYREIAMENSNYGGMENVGNTTILSSRLTMSDWLVDGAYVYMEGVKIHEFYHNINGSQVTGASPFEIWLNEAVTVHIQRQREYTLFGHDLIRLGHIKYAFTPASGPLAQDRSPVSMAVEPVGFNSTTELVSNMTYRKAPEFVRMVELVLGPRAFVRALENYHRKYAFGNATTAQWIAEMAALAPPGVDLPAMAQGWLSRTGYPTVTVRDLHYDAGACQCTLTLEQSGYEAHAEEERYPWVIPVDWALVKEGAPLCEGVFLLSQASQTLTVEGVACAPDFVSIARDWSFFGETKYAPSAATPAQRMCQALSDPDVVNRYLAVQAIVDEEKARLVQALRQGEEGLQVQEGILALFTTILQARTLSRSSQAKLLTVEESIPNYPHLAHHYQEVAHAKVILQQAIFDACGPALWALFQELYQREQQPRPLAEGIADRMLLMACFSLLQAGLDRPTPPGVVRPARAASWKDVELLAYLKPLLHSYSMTNRAFALQKLLQLYHVDESERQALLDEAQAAWTQHPIGCEQFISSVANSRSHQAPQYIRRLMDEQASPFFHVALAGHARAVAHGWSSDRKMAVLTEEGRELTKELFLRIGKVNQMSAYPFFNAFGEWRKFDEPTRSTLQQTLRDMLAGLDPTEQESLYNQLTILLSDE